MLHVEFVLGGSSTLDPGETETCVMLFHHLVLGRGKIFADDLLITSGLGALHHCVQGEVLHPSLQYPTTHEPGIDKERFRVLGPHDDDGDQAIIAKLILECKA